MPWNVKETDRCPNDKPWGVIGGWGGNHLIGCHPDKASAEKQQAALYANAPKETAYSTPPTEAW